MSVTVYIAAVCTDKDDTKKIVLCRDWHGEIQGVGSSENIQKLRELAKGWVAILAGSDPRAEELCIRFEAHMKEVPFTEENIVDEARSVFHKYKNALTDSYFNSKYGFAYSFIVNHETGKFGENFGGECLNDAAQISVGAELIIVGFVDVVDYADMKPWRAPMILLVSENNDDGDVVSLENKFTAIGSGQSTAKARHFLINQDSDDSTMETIYALYEAKGLSGRVPGVGGPYSINVMHEDGTLLTLSDEGAKRCKELFAKFGPREKTENNLAWFEMKESYLEDC
jgi:ATP-dependent protease HslVU (ClpYQ) peptidase subunit